MAPVPMMAPNVPKIDASIVVSATTIRRMKPRWAPIARMVPISRVRSSVDMVNELLMMTAGGAAGDFNNNGWTDLFVLGGGHQADALFINNGDGTFTDEADLWLLDEPHVGSGVAVGDYNNDGWLDMFVTSFGDTDELAVGRHRLYRNNGDGTFTNVAEAAGVTLMVAHSDRYSAVFLKVKQFLTEQAATLSDTSKLTNFVGGSAPKVNPARDPHERALENLVHVLINHNDFVTVR